jgi:site-specific recombinase XerD
MNDLASTRRSFNEGGSTSSQNDPFETISGFSLWLKSKSYSSSTIRNYLSDVNAYVNLTRDLNIFSSDTVSSYLQTIQKNPAYSRYLSSLSKFFQYALDQNLIKVDPLKQAQKIKKPSTDDILSDYQSFLTKKHFSPSTIRNYLNDLRQFIDWNQTNTKSTPISPESIPIVSGTKKGVLKFKLFNLPFFKGRNLKGEGFES